MIFTFPPKKHIMEDVKNLKKVKKCNDFGSIGWRSSYVFQFLNVIEVCAFVVRVSHAFCKAGRTALKHVEHLPSRPCMCDSMTCRCFNGALYKQRCLQGETCGTAHADQIFICSANEKQDTVTSSLVDTLCAYGHRLKFVSYEFQVTNDYYFFFIF